MRDYKYLSIDQHSKKQKRIETIILFIKILFCIFILGFTNWLCGR